MSAENPLANFTAQNRGWPPAPPRTGSIVLAPWSLTRCIVNENDPPKKQGRKSFPQFRGLTDATGTPILGREAVDICPPPTPYRGFTGISAPRLASGDVSITLKRGDHQCRYPLALFGEVHDHQDDLPRGIGEVPVPGRQTLGVRSNVA